MLEGRGLTSIWGASQSRRRTVEWQKHSLFLLPRNRNHQLSNTQGERTVRLLHYNYLPLAMSTVPEPNFFFNNPYEQPEHLAEDATEFYAEAKATPRQDGTGRNRILWLGNFFPDMRAWDKLDANQTRGPADRAFTSSSPALRCRPICPSSRPASTRRLTGTGRGGSLSSPMVTVTQSCGKKGKRR